MRLRVSDISLQGRTARGVRCLRLQPGDALVSAARVVDIGKDDEDEATAPGTPPRPMVPKPKPQVLSLRRRRRLYLPDDEYRPPL